MFIKVNQEFNKGAILLNLDSVRKFQVDNGVTQAIYRDRRVEPLAHTLDEIEQKIAEAMRPEEGYVVTGRNEFTFNDIDNRIAGLDKVDLREGYSYDEQGRLRHDLVHREPGYKKESRVGGVPVDDITQVPLTPTALTTLRSAEIAHILKLDERPGNMGFIRNELIRFGFPEEYALYSKHEDIIKQFRAELDSRNLKGEEDNIVGHYSGANSNYAPAVAQFFPGSPYIFIDLKEVGSGEGKVLVSNYGIGEGALKAIHTNEIVNAIKVIQTKGVKEAKIELISLGLPDNYTQSGSIVWMESDLETEFHSRIITRVNPAEPTEGEVIEIELAQVFPDKTGKILVRTAGKNDSGLAEIPTKVIVTILTINRTGVSFEYLKSRILATVNIRQFWLDNTSRKEMIATFEEEFNSRIIQPITAE